MRWLWSRREFLMGVVLMILPHHRPGHNGGPKPSPTPPPPMGNVFVLRLSALRNNQLLRAA